MKIINDWKPLTIFVKSSILDYDRILETPLNTCRIRTYDYNKSLQEKLQLIKKLTVVLHLNKITTENNFYSKY